MITQFSKTIFFCLAVFLTPTAALAQDLDGTVQQDPNSGTATYDFRFNGPPGGFTDSFFDIFVDLDLQPGQPRHADSFFDVFVEIDPVPEFQVDSFFDIFYEIDIPNVATCNPCDVLRVELEEAKEDKEDIEEGLSNARRQLADADADLKEAKAALEKAQKLHGDLTNPDSWAESEGRRVDTSDLRVMEAYNRELWGRYQSDDLTVDEYQQKLRDGLTDEEHEARKAKMIKEAEKDVKDLKEDVQDAQGDRDDWQDEVGELEGLLSDIHTKIEDLLRKLQDCVNRCIQGPVDIVKDYGMGQPPERGWFERFIDSIFGGQAGSPQDIPSDGLPLPLPPLPLQPFPPSFFGPPTVLPADPDTGLGITFPPFPLLIPECDECDGLLQLIKEVEEELGEMAKDLDELRHDIGDAQLQAHRAQQERDQAQRNLDRFNNPPSSASSGDTYRDSSDLEVEREYNRELWQQYRDGDLTAQELEQTWEEGLSDKDRERLKEERKEDLEEDLEDAQEDLEEANEDVDALERILTDAKKATDALLAELKKLEEEYEKCLKKCMEKKDIIIGGGILDFPPVPLPPLFEDGFESGDTSSWNDNAPQSGRITFGDGFIIRPGESLDPDEILRQSDQFDSQTGQLDLGDQKLEYDKNGNLIISNIGSSGEDGVGLDSEPPLDDTGFFCGTLGLFCPKERCPAHTSFESIAPPSPSGCSKACQNGAGGCAVLQVLSDGRHCIMCGPPIDEGDGFADDVGDPEDDETDLCEDVQCDDGDECTEDECNPETGECINTPIDGCGEDDPVTCDKDGGSNSMAECQRDCDGTCGYDGGACWMCTKKKDCSKNDLLPFSSQAECESVSPLCPSPTAECQSHNTDQGDCWGCVPKEVDKLSPCRESDRWQIESEARSACASQDKIHYKVTDYCWGCKDAPPQREECESPTKTESACRSSCDGTCTKSYTRNDGVKCYDCLVEEGTTCPADSVENCSDCSSGFECFSEDGCSFCRAVVDDGPTCPSGTVSDRSSCESQCAGQGGVCLDENEDGCFECTVVNCPSGTFKDECPSSCADGCDTAAEQHGVSCFTCKQSCEEFCGSVGLEVAQDYSSYILGQLNGHSCVSGAGISVQSASRGDCNCLSVPEINVDTTVPICAGTSCGDVACGQSATCSGGENTTITVTCNWRGWEQVDEFQFRPVLGQ